MNSQLEIYYWQKLAGIITESQYYEKKRLLEDYQDAIEIMQAKYVGTGKISQDIFNKIKDAVNPPNAENSNVKDNKGKGAYINWLILKVAGGLINIEDVYKYKEYLDIFTRNKNEYPIKDINQIKTEKELKDWLSKTLEIKRGESEDISTVKGIKKSDKYKKLEIGQIDGFVVYKLPKGRTDLYGASCELGSGTEWCTATGKTRDLFDKHIQEDDLYIFVRDNEKYQFHYATNQFMDKNDTSVS